jgi:single-stranded-DNA-specific exonuclease
MTIQFIERSFSEKNATYLEQSGIHPVLSKLFAARGVEKPEELALELKHLIPPSQLKNCESAAVYLANAIESKKRLLIVADYDCDGATACAVGIRGLRALGAPWDIQIDYFVPNRFTLGYGLTPEVVELVAALPNKPDILITVDNGIASLSGVEKANELGIEVLVTDHHLPADQLPRAAWIVNPNQPHCSFPSKALAGVGVMFYLLIALRAELRKRGVFTAETQPRLENLLDLVALGTVADVASLDRNNRVLVANGIKRIKSGQMQAGIRALYIAAGKDPSRSSTFDLGFTLGPRLNAAGRLADMSLGIQCLLSDSQEDALRLAHELDRMNRERRTIEADMQETALASLVDIQVGEQATLCLTNESWHQGVIGIVASRLKEKFHRPTLIFAPGEEAGEPVLKGSGRSITGFHLRDALDLVSKKYPDLILKFGGHAMAAGLTIHQKSFETFKSCFEKIAQDLMTPETLQRQLAHDGNLDPDYIEPELGTLLAAEVWGQGFPAPVFVGEFEVLNQTLIQDKHLKLQLKAMKSNGSSHSRTLNGIWFSRNLPLPNPARLAYRLVTDHYQGVARAQLHIEALDEPL